MQHCKPHDLRLWLALFYPAFNRKPESNPKFSCVCTGDITLIPHFSSIHVLVSLYAPWRVGNIMCNNFDLENLMMIAIFLFNLTESFNRLYLASIC